MSFPTLLDRESIRDRLAAIFPEGTPEREKCVRDAAAATIYAALYVGAVAGADRWLGPAHVYRMTEERARTLVDDAARDAYRRRPKLVGKGRWYEDNSREHPCSDSGLMAT